MTAVHPAIVAGDVAAIERILSGESGGLESIGAGDGARSTE